MTIIFHYSNENIQRLRKIYRASAYYDIMMIAHNTVLYLTRVCDVVIKTFTVLYAEYSVDHDQLIGDLGIST